MSFSHLVWFFFIWSTEIKCLAFRWGNTTSFPGLWLVFWSFSQSPNDLNFLIKYFFRYWQMWFHRWMYSSNNQKSYLQAHNWNRTHPLIFCQPLIHLQRILMESSGILVMLVSIALSQIFIKGLQILPSLLMKQQSLRICF